MRFYLASAIRPAGVNIKLETFLYVHLPSEFSVSLPYRPESGRMTRRNALPVMTLALLLAQPAPASAQWDCNQRPNGEWDCSASETPAMQPAFPAAPLDAAPVTGPAIPPAPAPAAAPQPNAADTATGIAPDAVSTDTTATAQAAPQTTDQPSTAATPAPAPAPDTEPGVQAPAATTDRAAPDASGTVKPDRWAMCPPMTLDTGTDLPAIGDATDLIGLEADSADASADRVFTLSGDAVVRYGNRLLQASDITFRQQTGEIEAAGGIRFTTPDLQVTGDSALLQSEQELGTLRGIAYTLPNQHARGVAGVLSLEGSHRQRLEEASYTTCPPGNQDWLLSADEVEIDHDEGIVTARDAKLTFKRVPILYTPYISFPLDDRRKSGLLFPKVGTTDETGVDISIPWYWNIAPNRDATITPRIMTDRGTMLGGEFRFMTAHSAGTLTAEYLPSDDEFSNRDRSFVSLSHSANPKPRLETYIRAGDVSDPFYFGDFGSDLATTSQTSLERTAHAVWHGRDWNMGLTVQDFQNLDTTLAPADRPYRQLPQIVYELSPARRFLGLRSSARAELNYFTHSDNTLVKGTRFDIQPRLSLPLRRAGGYIEPALSVRHTTYALDNVSAGMNDSPSRTTPVYSLDAGTFFERNGSWGDHPYVQTLEPRLFYLYVPEKDQTDLPVFDTGNYDSNFWALFRDNRFNGPDRMGDANQLALAVTTRVLDPASGRQLLSASLGSLLYFRDRTVTLPGNPVSLDSSSDIIAELSLALTRHWTVRGEVLWNPNESRTERNNFRVQYRLDPRRLINLGYRYRNGIQEQTDVSFLWPLGNAWHMVGRWYYDVTADETIEALGGLGYERCCWGVQLLARNYINNDGSARTTAVFLQLEFKGLGKLGTSVDDALERGILGYQSDN